MCNIKYFIASFLLFYVVTGVATENPKVISETPIKQHDHIYIKRLFDNGTTDLVDVRQELKLKTGLVRVISKQYDDASGYGLASTLLFGKTEVFVSKTDNIRLYGAYYIKNKTYILIGENCGGSGCRYDDLSVLCLNASKPASIFSTKDFFSENNSIEAKVFKEKIIVNLGHSNQASKTAVFKNGKINILYKKIPYKPLTKLQCSDLYKIAEDCIKIPQVKEFTCAVHATDLQPWSNSGMWALRYIKNESGFKENSFNRECLNACNKGYLAEKDKFEKSVCGIGVN